MAKVIRVNTRTGRIDVLERDISLGSGEGKGKSIRIDFEKLIKVLIERGIIKDPKELE